MTDRATEKHRDLKIAVNWKRPGVQHRLPGRLVRGACIPAQTPLKDTLVDGLLPPTVPPARHGPSLLARVEVPGADASGRGDEGPA
jgi:hypothetical protein